MMYWEYAGFFRCGMVTRNERNAIVQHGTMTLIRKAAMQAAGGWAEWCICEDSELGLKLMRHGWEAVYVPDSLGRGVMPDDFAAYRKQRHRWAYGAVQIVKGHLGALLNPFRRDLTRGQRWHFVMGWMPWLGDALGLVFVLFGLVWSAGLIFAMPWAEAALGAAAHALGLAAAAEPLPLGTRFEFPILLFMLPSLGLFAFKLFQILALYAARVPCTWRERIGAAVAGLALTHAIGKAVLAGLVTRRAPFLRTPKMENAPALVQGLVMARQELVLMARSRPHVRRDAGRALCAPRALAGRGAEGGHRAHRPLQSLGQRLRRDEPARPDRRRRERVALDGRPAARPAGRRAGHGEGPRRSRRLPHPPRQPRQRPDADGA